MNTDDFSIDVWYPKFEKNTYETKIIPIPDECLYALKNDCNLLEKKLPKDFIQRIEYALKSFSNSGFIKNNWHAPMDAKIFSLNNLLQACNVQDVLTYITSSQILLNDFEKVENTKFCIAIRSWKYIHPASEFRCIVVKNILRGITPRSWPAFYSHFEEEAQNIINILKNFFEKNIKNAFNHPNYTFDVVLNIPHDIILLDFGSIDKGIDFYAFKWKEINKIMMENDCDQQFEPVFRYLKTSKYCDTKINALLLPDVC